MSDVNVTISDAQPINVTVSGGISQSIADIINLMNFDSDNYITYNDNTNKFEFFQGGSKIAELDSNGNLKIKGEVSVLQTF